MSPSTNIEFAVHEGFGTGEHRIEGDRAFGTRRLDDDMDRIAGSVAEFMGSAVGAGDGQVSGADQARDDALQQYVHGSYPFRRMTRESDIDFPGHAQLKALRRLCASNRRTPP